MGAHVKVPTSSASPQTQLILGSCNGCNGLALMALHFRCGSFSARWRKVIILAWNELCGIDLRKHCRSSLDGVWPSAHDSRIEQKWRAGKRVGEWAVRCTYSAVLSKNKILWDVTSTGLTLAPGQPERAVSNDPQGAFLGSDSLSFPCWQERQFISVILRT